MTDTTEKPDMARTEKHLAHVNRLLQKHKLVEGFVRRQDMPRHDLVEILVHKQDAHRCFSAGRPVRRRRALRSELRQCSLTEPSFRASLSGKERSRSCSGCAGRARWAWPAASSNTRNCCIDRSCA